MLYYVPIPNLKKTAHELRLMLISCLLSSLQQAATKDNIQSGFRSAGIVPLNRDKPLSSDFAMKNYVGND